MQNQTDETASPRQYVNSLPTPSERLYAAAFADYLKGRSARPTPPDEVRPTRAAAIEATLKAEIGHAPGL